MTLYSRKLVRNARKLRNDQTPGEYTLWSKLKGRQVLGYKFRRQVPIENYIVDFFCKELSLIIEIDGSSHSENKYEYDQARQKFLERRYKVLRFSEFDAKNNFQIILDSIVNLINDMT